MSWLTSIRHCANSFDASILAGRCLRFRGKCGCSDLAATRGLLSSAGFEPAIADSQSACRGFESLLRYFRISLHHVAHRRPSPQHAKAWAVSFALQCCFRVRTPSHRFALLRVLTAAPRAALPELPTDNCHRFRLPLTPLAYYRPAFLASGPPRPPLVQGTDARRCPLSM